MTNDNLTDYWVTTAVTALAMGWITVYENDERAADGSWFHVEPCPGVLLQERRDSDGDRETRVITGRFTDGLVVLEEHGCLDDVYTTTTAEQWAAECDSAERFVTAARERIREKMLDRLAAAGAEGVTAADLVAGFNLDPDHRAVAVRRQLEIEQPNVATEWVPRPDAIGGRECIFRITDPMSDTNETIQRA